MTDWQSIETAPKDGTPILLYDPRARMEETGIPCPVQAGVWVSNGRRGWWSGYYGGTDPVDAPTHWMPLPEPPK